MTLVICRIMLMISTIPPVFTIVEVEGELKKEVKDVYVVDFTRGLNGTFRTKKIDYSKFFVPKSDCVKESEM